VTDQGGTPGPANREWPFGAAFAAFGIGTIAALADTPIAWPLAAFFVGTVSKRRLAEAALGIAAAATAWSSLRGSLAPPPAYEGPDYGLIYGIPILVISSGILLWLGARLMPDPPQRASGRRIPFSPVTFVRLIGVLALVTTLITTAVQVAVPSRRSFDIALPAGWNVLPRTPLESYYDPTFGAHFTAVLGSSTVLGSGTAADPVVGVTVIRTPISSLGCIESVHGWSSGSGPVYAWSLVSQGAVDLPAGAAYRVERIGPDGRGRLYGWGVVHTRRVGPLTEDLCYMLVVTTPSDERLRSEQADAIAATFRFR
jgi:hypothetical protein